MEGNKNGQRIHTVIFRQQLTVMRQLPQPPWLEGPSRIEYVAGGQEYLKLLPELFYWLVNIR